MNVAVRLGLILGVVGAIAFPIALWDSPWRGPALAAAVLGAIGVGAGFHLLRRERYPAGPLAFGIGSLLLLPAGAVGALGAFQAWRQYKFGTTLGRKREESAPRTRQWTLGTAVYGVAAVACLAWSLIAPRVGDFDDISEPLVAVSAALLSALCGIEAVLLWNKHDEAVRLGMVLSGVMTLVCLMVGFYLHNYFAIALLALPVYGAMLVWTGREKWDGIDRSGPGIEGRGRRGRAVPS